jgi:hypothetical protein
VLLLEEVAVVAVEVFLKGVEVTIVMFGVVGCSADLRTQFLECSTS